MIETGRLLIRRWVLADLDAWAAIQGDARVMSFWPRPFARADSRAWIERALASYAAHGFGRYALLAKPSGRLVGDCGIMRMTLDGAPVNDIGWIVDRPNWGRGLAQEAAAAVRDHAFATLGLAALHANMPWNHEASRRVAAAIGMRKCREFDNAGNRGIRTLLYTIAQGG